MILTTKGDLINAALRKIGVASDSTLTDVEPQSMEDGLNDLETMMAEWLDDGIEIGYLFSSIDEQPLPDDLHGLKQGAISAVFHNVGLRIAPDYLVEPSQKVISVAQYGKERLIKLSAADKAKKARDKTGYPNRMPIGSGNRWLSQNGWNYFHQPESEQDD